MSSAAEEPSPSPAVASPPEQATIEPGSPTGANADPEPRGLEDAAGAWSAGTPADFDEYAAENEASKVFALWQLGPDLMKPATGASQGAPEASQPAAVAPTPDATSADAENDVWAAAGETERMPSP